MRLREKFDPARAYEANKPFKWGKSKFVEGDPFPNSTVTCSDRKVRQMYEARYIRMRPLDERKLQEMIAPVVPMMPDFERLSAEAICNWLSNQLSNEESHALNIEGMDHSLLVKIAREQWNKIHGVIATTAASGGSGGSGLDAGSVVVFTQEENGAVTLAETRGDLNTQEEHTNGVATADGDSEHSGAIVQRDPDDGDAEARDTHKPRRQRRPSGRHRHHI